MAQPTTPRLSIVVTMLLLAVVVTMVSLRHSLSINDSLSVASSSSSSSSSLDASLSWWLLPSFQMTSSSSSTTTSTSTATASSTRTTTHSDTQNASPKTDLSSNKPSKTTTTNTTTNTTTTTTTNTTSQPSSRFTNTTSNTSHDDNDGGGGRRRYYAWFDKVAPTEQSGRTHYLTSIPPTVRWNATAAAQSSIHDYLYHPQNQFPQRLHLFEFNPSIVRLPEEEDNDNTQQHQQQQQQQRTSSTSKLLRDTWPTATYLASYRVSAGSHACFDTDYRGQLHGGGNWSIYNHDLPETDFLGLAILDQNLDMIADGVFSIKQFDARQHHCWFGDCSHPEWQRWHGWRPTPLWQQLGIRGAHGKLDYRLFVLHNQIYVSFGIYMVPLFVSAPTSQDYNTTTTASVTKRKTTKGESSDQPFALPQVFPGTSQLQAWMRPQSFCGVHENGKNLQYFVNGTNHTLVEIWPSNPHDVREINLQEPCDPKKLAEKHHHHPTVIPTFPDPQPSFGTMDEVVNPPQVNLWTNYRGSACCVRIAHPYTHVTYRVGIAHPKTPYPGKRLPPGIVPNTYLSSFYAFEENYPHQLVARTGKFCLGYAQSSDNSDHPLWNMQDHEEMKQEMKWGDHVVNCPRLHFVMSMIDHADDPNRVIISYGVGDCLSRFIQVDKREIALMLWDPAAWDASTKPKVS